MTDREHDDMGDDEQRTEIELTERYVEDPPEEDEDVVVAPEDGELSVEGYLAAERRPNEPDDPPLSDWDDADAADESSFHVETEGSDDDGQ